MKNEDLTKKRFGYLVVIKKTSKKYYRSNVWLCKCKCGREVEIPTNCLNSGNTKSCGCLQKEALINRNKTHGLSKEPIYQVWNSMKMRCLNQNDIAYKNYGGRGIKINKRWLKFNLFYIDIGRDYKSGLLLDRIDNNGNYCKENCRWATRKEQNNNKRNNRIFNINNKTKSLTEWCEITGMKRGTLSSMLNRDGKSCEYVKSLIKQNLLNK